MAGATPPPNTKAAPVKWQKLFQHNDVLLAVGMVLIVCMMIIPIPSQLLDMLLTVNIALSLTILLVTLYTTEPLQYSTFPIILLLSTLFRLGLNVSTTRLILLYGEAGSVVHAFGSFVIGGNYVVGLLIFIILIIINFIVITNGAGRVSEVAARFTLDAMPGKQLSIDADLNAGTIDEKEAKRRRTMIQKEADFYGTMDGASKFVKGDAIAAIIITVINIVGGLIIGVVQLGMPIDQAASTYTILTVGDGLVSQMPALIISAATGLLVTRVSDTDDRRDLSEDIGSQMFQNPKVLGVLGGLLIGMGLIPGLPTIPFLLVGGVAGGAAYLLYNTKKQEDVAQKQQQEAQEKAKRKKKTPSDNVMDLLTVEPLELEIGYRLVPLIEAEAGGDLLERIAQIRRQVATELGMVLPSVRVRDNLQLPANQYNVKLKGITVATGEVMADMWLAMSTDPDGVEPIEGIETREPAFGLPALWIEGFQKLDAEMAGYTVVSASAVVSTHLTEIFKRLAPDILSRKDVQELLENVRKSADSLVNDLIPDTLSVAELHVILQNLLKEKVSIRDMSSILEALSYHCRVSKDADFLTEQVRMALSRAICKQHLNPDTGDLPVVTLAPEVEEMLAQGLMGTSLTQGENGLGLASLALSPTFTQDLLQALNREVERVISSSGTQPVLLCNAKIRLPFRRLIERILPQIAVLSYNEIGPTVRVQALGSVRIESNSNPLAV
ncbi:MAG: flagellar biosynthesis protein FlhA [Candidatus Melainabacteria bacterium]|nr:flagellar biosynthesis protein FlhA [Candidatus Melainabacteria bacterium]